jgi:hypothetical protein
MTNGELFNKINELPFEVKDLIYSMLKEIMDDYDSSKQLTAMSDLQIKKAIYLIDKFEENFID